MAGMRSQPQAGQRLNQAHPLTRGLVGFWLPMGAGFVSALPGVPPAVLGAGAQFSGDAKGRRLGSNGSGLAAAIAHSARVKPAKGITVLTAGVMPVGSAGSYPYALGCESSNDGWGVYHYGGQGAQLHPYLRVGSAWADQPANIYGGDAGQVGFTFDGSTFWSVANGARSSSQAISGTITNSAIAISINAVRPNGENPGDGKYHYFAIWDRALSPAELASFHADPWQIFDDGEDGAEVLATLASYKLTASAGTFAAVGSSAGLRVGRRLAATSAALSVGGGSAGLRAQRRLVAACGEFGLAPMAASLALSRRLSVATGAFSLTGAAAQLRVARALSAGTGAFALSGSSIAMGYAPVPGPGAPTYMLSADVGAFGLAGAAVALRVQRRLPAASGGLLLNGAPAAFQSNRRLAAGAGGFTLEGASVSLRAARRIPAQPGTFDLGSAGAKLSYSAQIDYARAPAGPGYAPQQHYNQSRPAATSVARPAALQRNNR